jgi:ferredoxin-NADP reductase
MKINKAFTWLSKSLVNHSNFKGFFEPIIQLVFSGWSASGYRAKVITVRDETESVYSLVLKVSKRWIGFKPGQYVEITCIQDGARISRTFSISSPRKLFTHKRIIELSIRKQENGRITPWIYETFKTGQIITLSQAKGDFTIPSLTKPLLFIAGGSGITPFRSILAEYVNANYLADVKLMYYAQNNDHLFSQELQKLQDEHSKIKIALINTKDFGHINIDHLNQHCDDFKKRETFICGPAGMIQASEELLLSNGVDKTKINHEYFGPAAIGKLDIETNGIVKFIQSSKKTQFFHDAPKTLLELAESLGLKPITGCRAGICHQCVCKKQQGTVFNTLTKKFSDTGTQDIQLCVSVPVGDVNLNL